MSEIVARHDGVLDGASRSEAGLNQVERLVGAFVSPTRTFEDIRRSASWWLPWLVSATLGLAFAWVVLHRIGIPSLVEGVIQSSAVLQEQITNATPAQAATIRHGMEMRFQYMYMGPVIFLVVALVASAILLGTANFVFGGRATYKEMLAVWFYGTLPLTLISILTIVSLYTGMSGDQFNIRNTIGTNVGYWVMNSGMPQWLVTLLSSLDICAIWSAVLLTMGISIVARIKRGAAAATVFGWWLVYAVVQAVGAAFMG
jgi:hypothetical protein